MIYRLSGELTPMETRAESHELVDKEKRYRQIVECLSMHPKLTAKEIAVLMYLHGYTPTSERNFTAPRLTELSQKGIVEPVGKKQCAFTGRMVTVYDLVR